MKYYIFYETKHIEEDLERPETLDPNAGISLYAWTTKKSLYNKFKEQRKESLFVEKIHDFEINGKEDLYIRSKENNKILRDYMLETKDENGDLTEVNVVLTDYESYALEMHSSNLYLTEFRMMLDNTIGDEMMALEAITNPKSCVKKEIYKALDDICYDEGFLATVIYEIQENDDSFNIFELEMLANHLQDNFVGRPYHYGDMLSAAKVISNRMKLKRLINPDIKDRFTVKDNKKLMEFTKKIDKLNIFIDLFGDTLKR